VPLATKLVLRPYQVEGVEYLKEQRRALLFDQAGLGKTVQAIRAAQPPVLVFCPTYLQQQWADQVPDAALVVGTRAVRQRTLNASHPWYICNIEMLRGEFDLPAVNTIIIDEAHRLRGRKSAIAKAAVKLKTENLFLLTASPIYNMADDLYSLFHILHPKKFSSYWKFIQRYCTTVRTPFGLQVTGGRYASVAQLLRKNALGRKYDDVHMKLPPTIEREYSVEMQSWGEYKRLREEFRYFDTPVQSLMEQMHKLRYLTAMSKVLHLQTMAEDMPDALVFSAYRTVTEAAAHALGYRTVMGDMAREIGTAGGVCATLDALGEGIDASRFDHVVFLDHPWEPGKYYQALSRVVRSTRRGIVNVHHLVVERSIDSTIYSMLKQRNGNIKRILMETFK